MLQKETWGYAKEKVKKERKKEEVEKTDTKMSGVLETMGTKMPTIKKRDSPCSCKYFKFQQERYIFKEQSRIRLATKYSTHMHILI